MNSKCNHVIGNDVCETHHNNNWQDNIEEAVSSRRHFSEIVEEKECLTDRVDSWQYKDVTSAVGLANLTQLANMKEHSSSGKHITWRVVNLCLWRTGANDFLCTAKKSVN